MLLRFRRISAFAEACISSIKDKINEKEGIPAESIVLICGLSQLDNDMTVFDCELQNESTVTMTLRLCGGKKKKKRKAHTTPKKIPHKHENIRMRLLNYRHLLIITNSFYT